MPTSVPGVRLRPRLLSGGGQLAPDDHIARNNLGTIYLAMNQPAAALKQFLAGVRSAPANAQLHYNLGLANARLERFKEAESAYRETIRIDQRHDMALNNMGIVLYRQGRIREAVAAFTKRSGSIRAMKALQKI